MKKICAWCGKKLGQDSIKREDLVSHGICEDCSRTISFQTGVKLEEYLNTLDVPVIAVDGDVVVRIANQKALSLFGKRPEEAVGKRGGDVFECANARLPGGCGRSIHCSGCAIRRTVTETFQTGRTHLHVPATLNYDDPPKKIVLFISTEKIGDIVFLRIDRIER